jgi:aminoglycoside N3'-acetyltransferase
MPNCDYTPKEMVQALRNVGLERGDTAIFHTGLGFFGLPGGVSGQEGLNRLFLDCVREVLGPEGTMLVPTYTYSLCRGEVFDVRATPAGIGPFPEYFRTQEGVLRSQEPILSVCGQGPQARELFADLPPTTYGPGCLYQRLVERKAKVCTAGLGLNWATFLHHIEEMSQVPYRYKKLFVGEMTDGAGRTSTVRWTYYVRLWAANANVDARALVAMLHADGVCARAGLGRGGLCCIGADRYFEYASTRMRENPWLAAQGPSREPVELERERVPRQSFALPEATGSLSALAEALTPLPRDPVSDALDASLELLAAHESLLLHRFRTGTVVAGELVPERWSCREATLQTLAGEPVFSLHDSPLHVVSCSHGFTGEVDRAELLAHLHLHPRLEHAVPHVRNDFRRQWGLCCSAKQRARLSDARYLVRIDAGFSCGEMLVGELARPGNGAAEIVLCAHLGAPGQFNEGLSGALAGLEALRGLLPQGPGEVGCRLLLVPGPLGLRAWLEQAGPHPGRVILLLNHLALPGPLRWSGPVAGSSLRETLHRALPGVTAAQTEPAVPWQDAWRIGAGPDGVLPALTRALPGEHPRHPYPEHRSSADCVEAFGLESLSGAAQALATALKACGC